MDRLKCCTSSSTKWTHPFLRWGVVSEPYLPGIVPKRRWSFSLPFPLTVEVQSFNHISEGLSDSVSCALYRYSRSIRSGWIICHLHFGVLRTKPATEAANSHHPSYDTRTLLRAEINTFYAILRMLLDALPPGFSVPGILFLMYFRPFAKIFQSMRGSWPAFDRTALWDTIFTGTSCGSFQLMEKPYHPLTEVNLTVTKGCGCGSNYWRPVAIWFGQRPVTAGKSI